MVARRQLVHLWWLTLLALQLVTLSGCHLLFGDFKEAGSEGTKRTTCEKGKARCNDESLLVCNAEQTMWVSSNTCASKEQCDSTHATCLICPQADMLRCNGAKRETCSDDRSAWTMKEDCGSAELCSPAGCGPCMVPGQLQCSVDGTQTVLRECSKDKVWTVVTNCPNDAVCMATLNAAASDPTHWDRMCQTKCTPKAFKCDGATLYRCPASGLDWMSVAPCGTKELCDLTLQDIANAPDPEKFGETIEQCDPGCGAAGQPRCQNGTSLERCSDDQTHWEAVTTCPDGMQCTTQGEGSCIVCTPGDYQCNGAVLERCGADHNWTAQKDCQTPALCSFTNDTTGGGKSTGQCLNQRCSRAGDNVCGSDTDAAVPGSTLWECNSDLSGFTKGEACASAALCSAADKTCKPPICEAGARRCNPDGLLEVQVCKAGRDGWDHVTTCDAGKFCDANDSAEPCKQQCPAAAYCNDRTPTSCSAAGGIVSGAACASKELCECALNGTCLGGIDKSPVAGVSGCGRPVCGGADLANFRCTDTAATATGGPILQQCKPGRDGWATVSDCGKTSDIVCYPGEAPYFKGGYCTTCPTAGEVRCIGEGTSTCNADRKGWTVKDPVCGMYGCNGGGGNSGAYCQICGVGETRCSGTQLLKCAADQKTTPLLTNCDFGCLNNGTSDYCGVCGVGELRCAGNAPGSKLQKCSADQKGLADVPNPVCANGCIDNGTTDYCADCKAGDSECSGAGVRVCGDNGKWGPVTACANGCVDSMNADYCGGCAKNELRCSGSTLQQCSADQKTLTATGPPCAYGCIDSGLTDYCATCASGELRCSGANLQQCSGDQKTLTTVMACASGCIDKGNADFCATCAAGETRCNGATLQVCSADRTMLINSGPPCTSGCFDSGTADYCRECKEGDQKCTAGGLQKCGDDGKWAAATACANGCFGSGNNGYCGDCKPNVDTQCDGMALHTCTSDGKWSMTTTNCTLGCIDSGSSDFCATCKATDKSCSGSDLLSCVNGRYGNPTTCDLGCFDGKCAVCDKGETRCNGAALETCSNGQWGTGSTCQFGCFDTPTPAACGECMAGAAECVNGTSRRTCSNGHWTTATACPNSVCVGNMCAQCTPKAISCADSSHVQTCDSSGAWGAATACPKGACVNDACADCMPSDSECTSTTQLHVCSSAGTWGTATTCPKGACVGDKCADCMPEDTECTDSSTSRVCSAAGAWGTPTPCASGACLNDKCVACTPGVKECVGTTAVRTCDTTGAWQANVSCDYGCVENGMSDHCLDCPAGAKQCADTMTLRTCSGTWMTTTCADGCVVNGTSGTMDYCADCMAGEKECVGTTSSHHECGTDRRWTAATDCADTTNTKVCLAGNCVACKPGNKTCMDPMTQQTCDMTGSWGPAVACPNGCMDGACVPAP
jgi:hypothetical protein